MRILIDANLPRSLADRLRRQGHVVADLRDVELQNADDECVTTLARRDHSILVTRDFDFADVRNYPPEKYDGIMVVNFPNQTSAAIVVTAIESIFAQSALLEKLPGTLMIVEPGRIRLRPGQLPQPPL